MTMISGIYWHTNDYRIVNGIRVINAMILEAKSVYTSDQDIHIKHSVSDHNF